MPKENGLVISEVQNGISSVQRRKKRNERDFQQQAGAEYNQAALSREGVAGAGKNGLLRSD